MIFQLLWSLIGIFSVLGYLFLWIQQRRERSNAIMPKPEDRSYPDGEYYNNLANILNNVTSLQSESDEFLNPEYITTNLDDDDEENEGELTERLDVSQHSDVTDLDQLDDNDMSNSLEKNKLHYDRSFDAGMDDGESDFLPNDDLLTFFRIHKSIPAMKYYANCTINCKNNSEFLKITEGASVSIEDSDNLDYWINYDEKLSNTIAIIPKYCLSTSPSGSMSDNENRKRNTKEAFREDILKISNKNQESTMKRKYALADLIECDREYCATLKLIKDILQSLDINENKFGNEIDAIFSKLTETITNFSEFHDSDVLPKLSNCVMIPVKVATVLIEQKPRLYEYSELLHNWAILKNLLENSKIKHIFVQNINTLEKSKFSILSFSDLMKRIEDKLAQYISFLFDIMRYTGRIDGDIYDLQKAITVLHRIRRYGKEKSLLMRFIEKTEINISKERFVRLTDQVMVSETKVMTKSNDNLQFISEDICTVILLKNYIVCVTKNLEITEKKIMDLNCTKIFTKENYESQYEIILWSKIDKIVYRMFVLYFPTKVSKLGWIHDIKKRFKKKGINEIFVSSIECDLQYKQYLEKYQRLAAIEMESISLESASLDNDCSSIYDQLEDITSTAESTTDIRFESAVMDVPSSITSGSYKTAPETFKSSTDKASRPVSGISQDSISTLDGVRTPFSDEEFIKSVSIITETEEISVREGSNLTCSLKLINFEPIQYDIVWSLAGKLLEFNRPDSSIKIEEKSSKIYECELKKFKLTKLEGGYLSCKIVDKLNGSLITSKNINVFILPSCLSFELVSESMEITVLENELITFRLNVPKNSFSNAILKYLIWYKDNEKLNMKDARIKTFTDPDNLQIILTIEKSSISDAGIYTISCESNDEVSITNSMDISILLLVEKRKKTIYKTASLENPHLSGDSHIHAISPLKEIVNLGKDFEQSGIYDNAITSTTQISETNKDQLIQSFECEIEEIDLKSGETLSFNLKPMNILISTLQNGKWYLNSKVLNIKQLKGSESISEKQIGISIPEITKEFSGLLQFRIEEPIKLYSSDVIIKVRDGDVKPIKSKSYFLSEIKELEMNIDETLNVSLQVVGISLINLKRGSWYLNNNKVDLRKLKGKENLTQNQVDISIPQITKDFNGILQYRIDQPVKIYSPEIFIKIKEKEIKPLSTGFLDCEIEEIDLKSGETLSLTLNAVDIPLSTLKNGTWFLNSTKIDFIKYNGNENVFENRVEIIIPEVKTEFSGLLQFRIHTPVKLYSPEIVIKIRGENKRSKQNGSFTSEIKDLELCHGNTLEVYFNVVNVSLADLKRGVWFLNNNKLDFKKLKGKENISEKKVEINIPQITKDFNGILQYRIDQPVKVYSPEILIKIKEKEIKSLSTGFLDCEIEEIDLKSGETLSLTLNAVDIPLSTLKNGTWFLNSVKVDIIKYNGNENVSENKVEIIIPKVITGFSGLLQFRIEEPVKLYSPEIIIKIRENLSKRILTTDAVKKEKSLILELYNINLTIKENEKILLEAKIISGDIKSYQNPQWLLNDENLKNPNCKKSFNNKLAQLEINRCQISDAGQYKICFNPVDPNNCSKVVGLFIVTITHIKRNLKAIDSSIETFPGESVTLCVDVEGFLETDIKWKVMESDLKQEKLIKNARVLQKFNNNLAFLLLDTVTIEDSGTYVCQGFVNKELISECKIKLSVINNAKEDIIQCKVKFEKELYTVEVNKDVVLRAHIECSSTHYSVSWYFNGGILEMKSDISSDIKENGKVAELSIKNCTVSTSGFYDCIIENKDGHSCIAKTEVKVEDNKTNDKSSYFKCLQSKIEINEGNEMLLEVMNESKIKFEVQWSKNDIELDSEFNILEIDNKYMLKKMKTVLSDSGNYMFEAFKDEKLVNLIDFSVSVLPKLDLKDDKEPRLLLICDEKEIVVSTCQPLIISLEVMNWKQATVEWFRNNEPFGNSCELDSQFIDLYIENPNEKDHSGLYKCRVTNEKSESETVEITVIFQKETNITTEIGELLCCTVEEVDTIEDEKIELSVESKTPTQSLNSAVWFKNGEPLSETDPRLTVIMQPFCYNLILRNVKLSDGGIYSLKVNENSADVLVKVRPKPVRKQTKEIFKSLKIPKIKKPLEDIFIKSEPETVKFEFEVEECGPTKAIWYFENDEIEVENIEFIQWSCDNYFALTIPAASEKHCGKYTIQVANEMGCIKSDGRLSLILRTEIPEQMTESCCIAPLFTKKLRDIEILPKENIRLNCRMMCDAKPKILWTKDGQTLDSKSFNKRIKIFDEFPNFYLTITEAEVEDSGRYCCTATNFMGYDNTEATVTILDQEEKEIANTDDSKRLIVKPLSSPVLTADYLKGADVTLSWTSIATKESLNITYSIEKQKSLTSTNWKKLMKHLTNTTCLLSSQILPPNESHLLRCVATSEYGFETVSNIIEIPVRANAPILPSDKPTIVFKDATCAKLSWTKGRCKNLTTDESFGKVLYCLEMKDNPKSSWQIVTNELVENEYSFSLEPGVSYMFRVTAFNDFGISEPSQSLICRIDRLKLVPDFAVEPPWLHLKGQPCLKWRAATVPEYCDSCVTGITPEYKVEYRNGRLSPWKIYQDNIIQNEVYLTQNVIDAAQEFRISCRNKFGQNGPTRSYRLQTNIIGRSSQRSPSVEKPKPIIKYEFLKLAEIESISIDGLSLKWSSWLPDQINKYIIQRNNSYSTDWEQIQSIIFGENCFIELSLSENFSRQLRILALDENKTELHDGYNILDIPSKDQCLPSIPERLQVNDLLNCHEISWSESKCNPLIDSPVNYTLQCKTNNQCWFTIAEKLDRCFFTNTKIDKSGLTGYRVAAKNSINSSQYSKEIFTRSLINTLANEQIIKSIRYFVINPKEIEIKWHLCESIFDSGITSDDLSFQIEKKLVKESTDWIPISNQVNRNSLFISITFEEENLFRIQPFYKGEKITPSRIFRMYISKDLLVPDMSFTRPNIITDSITNCIIEWSEPELQSGFSPDGVEICVPSVLLIDLQYEIQFLFVDQLIGSKNRGKDIKNLPWTTLQDNLEENSFDWENPDPTQEYMFRLIAKNQFGAGPPSQVAKLHPQIIIPDFSFIRLSIDETIIPGTNGEKEITLSWLPPRISSDLYTPYSVDVQYRPMNYAYSDEEGWNTLKNNIKKNRVNIDDLDSNVNYQLRIVPVTDFGIGKPSMIIKRIRRHDSHKLSPIESDIRTTEKQNVSAPVFCCLSQNAELKFTKLADHKIDQITWTFNNSKIDVNEEKYKIFSAESYGIYFIIKNLEEEDFGEYCAMNGVQDPIQSFVLIKSEAPTFLNCLPNRSLNLHENFFISVKIDSQPPPTVIWRRNWKKMFSSYRTVISEDKETGIYSLMISKCILSDSGEYIIRAENAVGFTEIKFNLRVDAHPEKKSIQINNGDINDRYYTMKQLTKGSYSTSQVVVEKSTQTEFLGKFFDVNNTGIGKSEFQCIRNINHRNVVEIFDALSMPDQYLVIVYEKLQGLTLVEYISNLNHWCESQVRIIISQLVQAVAHLHENGICHLNIKPQNLIMTGKYNEILKLCGFSNAVQKEDFGSRRNMCLTSPFSAPELLKGDSITFNSDMWSIGLLTFLCLHGNVKVNFEGEQLYYQDTNDKISDSACDFIRKCLLLQSGQRITSSNSLSHEWFTNKTNVLNAALDYIIDQIIELMMYPEEMVPNFPNEMKNSIETFLTNSRPKVIFNSSLSNPDGSVSPPISQLSSRASSASKDGINYERFDPPSDKFSEEMKTDRVETYQAIDRHFVLNTTKELLFTVPLKDQTFKPDSVTSKTTVTLTCQLSLLGSEPISISWYKNQELLTDDSRLKLEVIKGGFLSCTILNATEIDVGIYRCIARCHSLRTETSARLVLGDIPAQPEQLSIYYLNSGEVLLKWFPYLSAIDDIIYRIDIKNVESTDSKHNWKTVGYSVDNRFLLENLEKNDQYIARIVAQNKYGFSPYSIATSVFQCKARNIHNLKQALIFNRKWMLTTRQSNHFNDLHDLIKDISSDDIRMNVIREHYSTLTEKSSKLSILKLNDTNQNYPEFLVQRTFKTEDNYPAIDLCIRMKYYHFPILYGEISDPTSGCRLTYEEYVPGGNLLSVLLARSIYSEFTVVTIIRQLLETVQFLHSNNVIHANIDPNKILVARRTNQQFDIKLIGLESCQIIGTVKEADSSSVQKMSIFKAPEFRYESITKCETDIWSLGVLTFLLLATQLPAIEDACSDSDVQCCVKNTNTLLLPVPHTHFRAPKLSILHKFSKSARKFVHNSLKKQPNDRGNADYWLASSWFKQDPQIISEMELQTISSSLLAEFITTTY